MRSAVQCRSRRKDECTATPAPGQGRAGIATHSNRHDGSADGWACSSEAVVGEAVVADRQAEREQNGAGAQLHAPTTAAGTALRCAANQGPPTRRPPAHRHPTWHCHCTSARSLRQACLHCPRRQKQPCQHSAPSNFPPPARRILNSRHGLRWRCKRCARHPSSRRAVPSISLPRRCAARAFSAPTPPASSLPLPSQHRPRVRSTARTAVVRPARSRTVPPPARAFLHDCSLTPHRPAAAAGRLSSCQHCTSPTQRSGTPPAGVLEDAIEARASLESPSRRPCSACCHPSQACAVELHSTSIRHHHVGLCQGLGTAK
jgi:hypothetical protein